MTAKNWREAYHWGMDKQTVGHNGMLLCCKKLFV